MTRKETYDEYLLSQHWADLRDAALNRSNRKCEACGVKAIHGHHLFYRDNLTDCTIEDIMALCSRCHGLWHDWLRHARKHVHDFCRQSTRGGILTLLHPLAPARTVKQANPNMKAKHLQSIADAIKTLDRESFKKFIKQTFNGKKRNSLRSSAMLRYDKAHPERLLEARIHKPRKVKDKPIPPPTPCKITILKSKAEDVRKELLADTLFKNALETFDRLGFKQFCHSRYKGNSRWNVIMANAFVLFDKNRPDQSKAARREKRLAEVPTERVPW